MIKKTLVCLSKLGSYEENGGGGLLYSGFNNSQILLISNVGNLSFLIISCYYAFKPTLRK